MGAISLYGSRHASFFTALCLLSWCAGSTGLLFGRSSSSSCPSSALGYACSSPLDSVTLHWTASETTLVPVNNCTRGVSVSLTANAAIILHLAATACTTGYVALGFSDLAGKMTSTKAVIGWYDQHTSTASASTYYINRYDVSADDTVTGMYLYSAVVQSSSGCTTVCFARYARNSSADASRRLSRHLSSDDDDLVDVMSDLQLTWAMSANGYPSLVGHTHRGGIILNVNTNTASATPDIFFSAVFHGIMMAACWALLLPCGAIIGRHKWLLVGKEWCGQKAWFRLHVLFQVTGILLFIIGIVIAFVKLRITSDDTALMKVHKYLGFAVIALAGMQLVGAMIRPSPGTNFRPLWELYHRSVGGIAIAVGWASCILGILTFNYVLGGGYMLLAWLIPVVVTMVLMGGILLALDVFAAVHGGPKFLNAEGDKLPPLQIFWLQNMMHSGEDAAQFHVDDMSQMQPPEQRLNPGP